MTAAAHGAGMTTQTNPEHRIHVHTAIRTGLESISNIPVGWDVVRAVADQVLALPDMTSVSVRDFPLIGGLPDAPAFAWSDYDHEEHVALRVGHPGNKVWMHNGTTLSAKDLIPIIGTCRVHALDWCDSPSTAPSEYRH